MKMIECQKHMRFFFLKETYDTSYHESAAMVSVLNHVSLSLSEE